MTIHQYLTDLNKEYKTGRATEHSYRGYLQSLIKAIAPDVMVTNEPQRVKCGAPDYIITKRDIPVGYIEAKDIGYKLDDKQYKEQFDRYRKSLNNLIITDYIDFWLYIDGELVTKVKIAEVTGGGIKPLPEHHNEFTNLIKDFCTRAGQTIKSSKKLAEMMAGKARMLSEVIEKALVEDEADTLNPDTALQGQLQAFKDILIHDIKPKEFADIYAQTIAYGMFAARLHDPTLPTFSRQEAAQLIPKTNPFLRRLFQYIAGYDLDQRLVWIVDGLADIFRATDVAAILKNFGKSTQTNDPIIHFYETFLSEYDPALRKARGVWYTPEPVVNFIVRAVDDILKTEFDLKDGLADTSKTKIKVKIPTNDKRFKAGQVDFEQEVHKVQILDPATGTGTFLAEVVKHIYKKFEGQQGIWSKYVDEHLVPRLNGFELLMASYAMAHLKLDMLLTETGYKQSKEQRFKIYLTNSLEEHHPDTGTLFANWLSDEANEANQIKRDTPVMVIVGNPPYSGESANKGEWIMNLMNDYKKEPGGKEKLKEKNPKWINADEYKFIRFGQHFIEKNGSGVLAYINPHSFLDNPTFRGMRWNLLKTYDKIYVLDLHGNSIKKESALDGSADVNVFDITQGVSINIFVKTGKKKANDLGKVFHFDLYGKREKKYDFLGNNSISSIGYKILQNVSPNYFFTDKDFDEQTQYERGFSVNEIFNLNNVGIVTAKDGILINDTKEDLVKGMSEYYKIDTEPKFIQRISYRPFDYKFVYYDTKLLERAREKVMQHFINEKNVGLVIGRQGQVVGSMTWNLSFITNSITDFNLYYRGGGVTYPLYLKPETNGQQTIEVKTERTPNLKPEIVKQISDKLGFTFTSEKQTTQNTFAPIDILDYIYAVLHSPTYREKYKEFLKIDFPRVPYPTNTEKFWELVKLGGNLRQIHLLESDTVNRLITQYPIGGDNVVRKIRFEENYELVNGNTVTLSDPAYPFGRVYINDTQYFQQVPKAAWEFYIGGYQPAQKWLKDRKDRELSFEDILHYQKIIVALNETIRLMTEVDKIGVE
jgi:predicted helicase